MFKKKKKEKISELDDIAKESLQRKVQGGKRLLKMQMNRVSVTGDTISITVIHM